MQNVPLNFLCIDGMMKYFGYSGFNRVDPEQPGFDLGGPMCVDPSLPPQHHTLHTGCMCGYELHVEGGLWNSSGYRLWWIPPQTQRDGFIPQKEFAF